MSQMLLHDTTAQRNVKLVFCSLKTRVRTCDNLNLRGFLAVFLAPKKGHWHWPPKTHVVEPTEHVDRDGNQPKFEA